MTVLTRSVGMARARVAVHRPLSTSLWRRSREFTGSSSSDAQPSLRRVHSECRGASGWNGGGVSSHLGRLDDSWGSDRCTTGTSEILQHGLVDRRPRSLLPPPDHSRHSA